MRNKFCNSASIPFKSEVEIPSLQRYLCKLCFPEMLHKVIPLLTGDLWQRTQTRLFRQLECNSGNISSHFPWLLFYTPSLLFPKARLPCFISWHLLLRPADTMTKAVKTLHSLCGLGSQSPRNMLVSLSWYSPTADYKGCSVFKNLAGRIFSVHQ